MKGRAAPVRCRSESDDPSRAARVELIELRCDSDAFVGTREIKQGGQNDSKWTHKVDGSPRKSLHL